MKQFARPVIYDLMVLNRRRTTDTAISISISPVPTRLANHTERSRSSHRTGFRNLAFGLKNNELTGIACCRGHRDRAAFLCRACNSFHVPLSGTGFLFPDPLNISIASMRAEPGGRYGHFTGVGDGWLCVAYVPLLTDRCVLPVNTAWDWLKSSGANEALSNVLSSAAPVIGLRKSLFG